MNILLGRSGGLGDCLLTLPVASAIKHLHPDAYLHILGNEMMLSAARLTDMFVGFHSLNERRFAQLYSDVVQSKFLSSFFSQFDVVFFLTAGDKEKIRKNIISLGTKACHVLDPRPPQTWNRHVIEHLLNILVDRSDNLSEIVLPIVAYAGNVCKREGLVIHTGSGGSQKNWPLERYIHIAEMVSVPATFIAGPVERERGIEKDITKTSFPVIYCESLEKLCEVVCRAEIYIGNDSGVSHMASFCRTPSLVLFGPSNPVVWRPLGDQVNVISSLDGTMEGISEEDVIHSIRQMGVR